MSENADTNNEKRYDKRQQSAIFPRAISVSDNHSAIIFVPWAVRGTRSHKRETENAGATSAILSLFLFIGYLEVGETCFGGYSGDTPLLLMGDKTNTSWLSVLSPWASSIIPILYESPPENKSPIFCWTSDEEGSLVVGTDSLISSCFQIQTWFYQLVWKSLWTT